MCIRDRCNTRRTLLNDTSKRLGWTLLATGAPVGLAAMLMVDWSRSDGILPFNDFKVGGDSMAAALLSVALQIVLTAFAVVVAAVLRKVFRKLGLAVFQRLVRKLKHRKWLSVLLGGLVVSTQLGVALGSLQVLWHMKLRVKEMQALRHKQRYMLEKFTCGEASRSGGLAVNSPI
eukprot:TRINITY_DN1584_c0_g1_i2.p1 TRINITY_DN1584_c0_g1~~TRINITY_DN1584_c0_g1_i2.p1  ORF type:complete len:175 (-),score=46.09 TRINITY_DN1584_c0_g1_i2:254-778(-)